MSKNSLAKTDERAEMRDKYRTATRMFESERALIDANDHGRRGARAGIGEVRAIYRNDGNADF
jgi:hypothetical protein